MERVYYKLYDYSLFVPDTEDENYIPFEKEMEEVKNEIKEHGEAFEQFKTIEDKPVQGSCKIIKEGKNNEV